MIFLIFLTWACEDVPMNWGGFIFSCLFSGRSRYVYRCLRSQRKNQRRADLRSLAQLFFSSLILWALTACDCQVFSGFYRPVLSGLCLLSFLFSSSWGKDLTQLALSSGGCCLVSSREEDQEHQEDYRWVPRLIKQLSSPSTSLGNEAYRRWLSPQELFQRRRLAVGCWSFPNYYGFWK